MSKKNELNAIKIITEHLEKFLSNFSEKIPVLSDKFRKIHENMTYKIKNKEESVKVLNEYLSYLNCSDKFKNKENLVILRRLMKENFQNSDDLNEIFHILEYSNFISKAQALVIFIFYPRNFARAWAVQWI